MGYKRLSEQPSASVIKDEDSIIGVFDGKLGLANVADWLSKINASFDISVDSDTAEEYILSITVGRKTVTTPNLKSVSIQNARIESGHLYFDMSDGTTIDSGYIGSDGKKYGVCYDFKSKNPKLTRLGDAKYLKAGIANGADDTNVVNDFDKIYPWCDIKRCTQTPDGTITSYEGDPNYTENGSIGEVMTEIPEHYEMKYISEATGKMYYYASREKINEYYKFVPKRYIGSFLMSCDYSQDSDETKLKGFSRSGLYFHYKYSLANARALANNVGENWHIMDIWDYEVIKTLFLIEFATLDSQSLYFGNLSKPANMAVDIYPNEECMIKDIDGDDTITDTEVFSTDYIILSNDCNWAVGDEILIPVKEKNSEEWDYYDEAGDLCAIRKITAMEDIDITVYPDYEGMTVCYFGNQSPITIGIKERASFASDRCGLTNQIKSSSGKLLREGQDNLFVWRGIENLLGAGYTILDGILVVTNDKDLENYGYWICDNPKYYDNLPYTYNEEDETDETLYYHYKLSHIPIPSAGYITKMGLDEETGLTLPIETGGTSDTGYCDNFSRRKTNSTIYLQCRYGATTTSISSVTSGLFTLYCSQSADSTTASYARLSYGHF